MSGSGVSNSTKDLCALLVPRAHFQRSDSTKARVDLRALWAVVAVAAEAFVDLETLEVAWVTGPTLVEVEVGQWRV